MSVVDRVVHRYLTAAGSLTVEFQDVLDRYRAGDIPAMQEFVEKVLGITLPPGGKPPAWFHGLGPSQRKNVVYLDSQGRKLRQLLDVSSDRQRSYVAGLLEAWGKRLKTLDTAVKADDPDRAVEVHGFKVITLPGIPAAKQKAPLEAIGAAAVKLKARFPKVIYGDIYLSKKIGGVAAAQYAWSSDKVYVDVNAKKREGDVFTIVHELGHRYRNKFLSKDLKDKFWALSAEGLSVSSYGSTNPEENFADAFAMYVMGKKIHPELKAVLDAAK